MNPKPAVRSRFAMALFLPFLAILATLPACSTIHQAPVSVEAAGNYVRPIKQPDGSYLVDDAFRDRYNALIATYGKKKLENGAPVFVPPLEKDGGVFAVRAGWWRMTAQAMEDMVSLSDLKRRGAAP